MRIGLGIFASAANVASSLSSNFVAVASGSQIYSYSEDAGVTWSSSTLPSSINWKAIINGQNKFVAIADSSNIVAYSTDAITWASSTLPVSQAWADIAYGNDKFVAMAISSTNAAISTDGITWAAMSIPNGVTSINSFNDTITVTRSSSSGNIYYSTNGITWNYTSVLAAPNNGPYVFGRTSGKTAGGQDITVATGYQGGSSLAGLAYSYNGTTWVAGSMPYTTTSNITYNAVAFGSNSSTKDSRFVAVAYGGYYTNPSASESSAYSVDGVTWNVATLPSSQIWTGIAFSGNNFVAVSKNSNIGAISTDGITWTSRTLSENQSWEDVAATTQNYTFKTAVPVPAQPVTAVTLGDSSTSAFTTDGTTWSSGTSIIGGTWTDGLHDSSKFIAVGPNSANVIYSTNGVSWQLSNDVPQTLMATYSDKYIAFNGSDKYLIASSQQYQAALSTDGITWTYASTPARTYSLEHFNNVFTLITPSSAYNIYYSTNGTSWTNTSTAQAFNKTPYILGRTSGKTPGGQDITVGVGSLASSSYQSLVYSYNGTTWIGGSMPYTTTSQITYSAVAFGSNSSTEDSRFVAVASGGYPTNPSASESSAYSVDGITWNVATLPSSQIWTGISYYDNKFIATANNTTSGATSTDGITWTSITLSDDAANKTLIYKNQDYTPKTAVPVPAEPVTAVTLGDSSTSAFTTDGTTWSSGTSIIGGTWTDGLHDSSKFIAVGPNSANVIYSTDGVSWQISNDVDNRLINTYSDKYMAFNGSDKYLIASSQQSQGALSTDGITWTYLATPVGTYSVGYGHDRFVIVNKDNNSSQVRYSTNGSSWSSVTPVSGLYYHIHGFAFDSSANIMVGVGKRASNYGSLLLSTDGTTWTTGTMPALGDITNITYNSVAFGNGNFVAVGTSGTSAYSTDGTTWTSVTMPSYGSWTGITYTDNKFIAISTDTSDAATSTDGSTWTIRSLPTSSNWNFIIGK